MSQEFRYRLLLFILVSLLLCAVIPQSIPAAGESPSGDAGKQVAAVQQAIQWDIQNKRVIEFDQIGEETRINIEIARPAKLALLLDQSDKSPDGAGYQIHLERSVQSGTGLPQTQEIVCLEGKYYLVLEPGLYSIRFDRSGSTSSKDTESKNKNRRLRLTCKSFELLPDPVQIDSIVGQDMVISAEAEEKSIVQPVIVPSRARIHMNINLACYPDLMDLNPPTYSPQKLEECKELGIKPAATRVSPIDIDILDPLGHSQVLVSNSLPYAIDPKNSLKRKGEIKVLLPEGKYALLFRRAAVADLINEKAEPFNLMASFGKFSPEPLPPEAVPLNSWLKTAGLDEYFSVADFFFTSPDSRVACSSKREISCRETLYNLTRERQRLFEKEKEIKNDKDAVTVTNPCETGSRGMKVSRLNLTSTYVILATSLDGNQLKQLEQDFSDKYDFSVWEAMFMKISSNLKTPLKEIILRISRHCLDDMVYWSDGKVERHRLDYCKSVSDSSKLTLNLPTLKKAASTTISQDTSLQKLSQNIAEIVKQIFASKGASVDVIRIDEDFIEMTIRKLRGEVIVGGRDWERLQVNLMTSKGENNVIKLRAVVDGRIASGVGKFPADTAFITDMEPRNSGALSEYTRKLLFNIKIEYAKKGGK